MAGTPGCASRSASATKGAAPSPIRSPSTSPPTLALDRRQRVEPDLREQSGARRLLPHESQRHRPGSSPSTPWAIRQLDPQAAANAARDVSEAGSSSSFARALGSRSRGADRRLHALARDREGRAENCRQGRIFIAGDAAHLMPPNGGFGGNTGIHDAHNLAWKLAAVLQGQASDSCSTPTQAERKPVARFTVEQAFSRYVARTAPWLQASQQPEPLVDDLNIELGYLYGSRSAGTLIFAPLAEPGSRAPHVWLRKSGATDLDDRSDRSLFVAAGDPAARMDRRLRVRPRRARRRGARRLLRRQGPRGSRRRLRTGLRTSRAPVPHSFGPDGFVAWRSTAAAAEPGRTLRSALAASLGH